MTAPQPWPPARLCPATSNLPTRMLPASWRTLCTAMQRRDVVGANRQNGMAREDFAAISAARFPCATCQGRMLPPGLELITQEEASEMARQTKRGICELCGAHTNVGMNHGSKACPACTHVQTALNKRPEAVAKAIRAMGKTEEMLGHLIPDGGGLAVKGTADLLQEISGIVGYDGEDPAELVAAVRKRVLTCASCDSEDVLHEIREIVDYSPDMGDSGLADAVRALADRRPASAPYWADLMRACGIEDDGGPAVGWLATAAAIQTIAELTNRRDDLLALLTKERADNASLYEEKINRANAAFLHTVGELKDEIARLNGQTHSESEQVAALRADNARLSTMLNARHSESEQVSALRAELTLAQQARDEWEQRAVQAESNVEMQESELRDLEEAPTPCTSNAPYLLDIALRALRGEGPVADQLAALIDAARRTA